MSIKINVDNTVGDIITVDELIELEGGKLAPMKRILGYFVYEDGNRLPPTKGAEKVGGLSINQLKDASVSLRTQLKETSVPN